jgi:hypothetical protein
VGQESAQRWCGVRPGARRLLIDRRGGLAATPLHAPRLISQGRAVELREFRTGFIQGKGRHCYFCLAPPCNNLGCSAMSGGGMSIAPQPSPLLWLIERISSTKVSARAANPSHRVDGGLPLEGYGYYWCVLVP